MRLYAGRPQFPALQNVAVVELFFTLSGSGAVTAPAAGAVITDLGPQPAGNYDILFTLSVSDTVAVGKELVVEHRNAANTATIRILGACPAAVALWGRVRVNTFAPDERVRVISGVAGAASSRYKASLQQRLVE